MNRGGHPILERADYGVEQTVRELKASGIKTSVVDQLTRLLRTCAA